MRVSPPYGSELFWHPADRNLMTQILAHERVKNLVDWIRDQQLEEAYQSVFRSSFLELREETAPEIHQLLRQACNLFGREELPGLYLTREPESTVELLGISRPIILLSDSFLRRLDQKALLGVLAGQVAGIQVGHHRGLTLAWLMETCLQMLPIPAQVLGGIEMLLNQWKRCRAYTCDRGYLLAVGELHGAFQGLLQTMCTPELLERLALGTYQDRYLPQVQAFFRRSGLDDVIAQANTFASDTAWLPQRYRELEAFGRQIQEGLV